MAILLPIPPSQSLLLQRRPSLHPPMRKSPHKSTTLCSSTFLRAPSASVVTQDDSPPPSEGVMSPETQPAGTISSEDPQFRGCKTCGREEIEKGCNGEGRIQGGIATVPGFGWWPIKAFRPCPGFVASGGRYKRRGQSMDEVTSGRGKRDVSEESTDKVKLSQKRQKGPRRLKG